MGLDLLSFEPEIECVNTLVRSVFMSTDGLARRVAEYLSLGGGKNLRPRLVLLAGRADHVFSRNPLPEDEPLLRMAACVEILHTASLLHDDVVDHAETRRGRPSVNSRFGSDVAILVADLMFSQAFGLALPEADRNVLRLLVRTTQTMCESELFQIETRDAIIGEEQYFRIIRQKTATLFGACAELGALMAGFPESRRAALAEYGHELGMAFQITDDTLDYVGASGKMGKPVGGDLRQGKQTLPLLHAYQQADEADRHVLASELRNGRNIEAVMPVIRKYRGLEYSRSVARRHVDRALEAVPRFAVGEAATRFEDFSSLLIDRDS